MVLRGMGRAFCAGADTAELGGMPEDIARYYRGSGSVHEKLAALPQPTVAAISGYCFGGGFELALACDFRVADRTACFALPEVSLGILPSSGGVTRLVKAVGPARARELVLLGERFGSERALALGLITSEVPEGDALDPACELAGRLAKLPGHLLEWTTRAIDAAADAPTSVSLLVEQLVYAAVARRR